MRGVVKNWFRSVSLVLRGIIGASVVLLLVTSCGSEEAFIETGVTDYFVQDFNPEMIDVLWVVDDRSQMSFYQSSNSNLIEEARKFFIRLDATASRQYRMAFTNVSGSTSLRPSANPAILTKNLGSVAERADYFRSIFGQVLNLRTAAENNGFLSAYNVLSSTFVPTANVPLVVVFISDGDDKSSASGDAVETFASALLSAKQNKSELLRVYSVNYTQSGQRCFTHFLADIDQAGFQNRYFRLADRLGGATGDVCGSWSSQIDLSGLRLRELPKRFKLTKVPKDDSLRVSIVSPSRGYETFPFKYDATTNEVYFDTAPPEGSTVTCTYHPR